MNLFLALHACALGSDGLRPELAELLRRRALQQDDPKIVELSRYRTGEPMQAGPFASAPADAAPCRKVPPGLPTATLGRGGKQKRDSRTSPDAERRGGNSEIAPSVPKNRDF